MIKVFTDAAVSSGVAVVSAIVLTDKAFIGFTTKTFHSVSTSLVGELHGILEGIKYAVSLMPSEPVTLFTDSDHAVRLINNNEHDKWSTEVNGLLDAIAALIKIHEISVEHFTGHQPVHNPNKIVDLTSKTILRNIRRSNAM